MVLRAVIAIESGPRAGARWLLRPGDVLIFGRSEQADVAFADDRQLSSQHFRLSATVSACIIEDLKSTNGTWVNEQRISKQALDDGDQIRGGGTLFVFRLESTEAQKKPGPNKDRPPYKDSKPDTAEEPYGAVSARLPKTPEKPNRNSKDDAFEDQSFILDDMGTSKEKPNTGTEDAFLPVKLPASKKEPKLDPIKSRPVHVAPVVKPASTSEPQPPRKEAPSDFEFLVEHCRSGLFRVGGSSTMVDAIAVATQLQILNPLHFIIDFPRAGVAPPSESTSGPAAFLIKQLAPDLARIASPQLHRCDDPIQRDDWLSKAWMRGALITICSDLPTPALLAHFHESMRVGPNSDNGESGLLGLCWPSVLSAVLREGKPRLCQKIIEPIHAIMLESNDSQSGWELLGDERLMMWLDGLRVPIVSVTDLGGED